MASLLEISGSRIPQADRGQQPAAATDRVTGQACTGQPLASPCATWLAMPLVVCLVLKRRIWAAKP